jgi:hypothetical protein
MSTSHYYPAPPPPPEPPKRHGLRNALIVVAVLAVVGGIVVAAVLLGTRGSDVDGDASTAESTAASTSDDESASAELLEQQREEAIAACERHLGPLLQKLHNIDSRLTIGMTQSEYSTALGDAQIVYDRIRFAAMELDCVSAVGVPAENAFNLYIRANNTWSDCIADLYCDIDADAMPQIQERWTKATVLLAKADRGLRNLAAADESIS